MHSPQSVQHLGSNDSDQFKLLILMVHELSTTCAREQKVGESNFSRNVEYSEKWIEFLVNLGQTHGNTRINQYKKDLSSCASNRHFAVAVTVISWSKEWMSITRIIESTEIVRAPFG
ncbi:hypothetical protein DERF_008561 [Dermatophagoides farinae]|uniref:Uncharacterized protein n=1 Tax=Dermatophagoides farinae TaxID=6954 RepID=A0A922L9B3_DERFA|nr:hypothetical protein DERF_008561 [Dermatophagoides farinae]